ncbi:ABC transporter ATP-binding protein [Shewanella avicenniae]|uniref:ABC transporter ATP-binding protein n=1 Tax=Shewanella avicenniae TaxID=2814294 RepID=A0ABX7QTQ2_9GAMM|nr:ABC transporter ATP-binding protein [Shewanella avicenniae]QSX34402.1 ABC transporter ATP-binding protein [Shewanella avicenniae]
MNAALRAENLSWSADGKKILQDVSFALEPGKMLGLIGPNGAGKSSLLRCLYRYHQPQAGRILLNNKEINSISRKSFAQTVAVVLQDTPTEMNSTVEQIVATGLTPYKGLFQWDGKEDNNAIQAALCQVGLADKAYASFSHLSGGEKQRALIARAIVQRPSLFILDEPTNHLDIRYQIQILELVRSLGITVIASIHDLNLASALCDELLLLADGRCVAHGDAAGVLTEERISQVFGVCCKVTPHPQIGKPLIHYYYGYQKEGGYRNEAGYRSKADHEVVIDAK